MQGTEERVHFSTQRGNRDGFVDAVVGKTAIEYEKNLTIQSIFNEGYLQVKEYCAALYNIGIPENEILGVLSDTVRWYGYSVRIIGNPPEGHLWGPDNVELEQITFVDLSNNTEHEFSRFEQFVNQFMARSESRLLNASTLVMDFGVDSSFYREYEHVFLETVEAAMTEKPDYALLIEQVWQNFIAFLGASDYGAFSKETYVNEFYLVTVAKSICANILAGRAILSNPHEIEMILSGEYFTQQNIYNLVDYDYFGWLNNTPYVERIIPCVEALQSRLQAYDFSRIGEQDIFGKLLAQLADKEHRLMLGQEFTPHWVAKDIVDYNVDLLGDETPQIMDMCCGSGVFLIEAVKAVRRKYNITLDDYSQEKDGIAFSCVMGFDIDPLAVMLAKVNWVMAMRDLFALHAESIIVPIYHADSLFVATPITHRMPRPDEDFYVLEINGRAIRLPSFLLSPEYRKVFDAFMSKAYRLAMTRATVAEGENGEIPAEALVRATSDDSGRVLSPEEKGALAVTATQLVSHLESLQRQGQNGIWHFIISNSYRPGLTKHQFNCIVSNPPWMAMSKLAENPYKTALKSLAEQYSIQPTGAAHPHMELATIFLLGAVDRYLKDGAHWSCIMPASIMSGLNHEKFRQEKYHDSTAALDTYVSSIWELPINTFKNKAVVLSGVKDVGMMPEELVGRVYRDDNTFDSCVYTLNRQGYRSAWTNRGRGEEVADIISGDIMRFAQGCDLFPRTALFHSFERQANGNWSISPIERTSNLWYLLSDSKKFLCNDLVAENFDAEYIYNAYISKHLSPFVMADPATVLIPGKKIGNRWHPIRSEDLALLNTSTAYVFRQISNSVDQELTPQLI